MTTTPAATDNATPAGQINPQELLDKGDAALKAGDFKTALKTFNDLATAAEHAASPEAYRALLKAYVGRGKALNGLKEFDAAIEEFKKVLDSDNTNVAALVGRGTALLENNQPDLALIDFQNAAKSERNNPEVLFGLGKALVALNRGDEAVKPLTLVLTADPKNAEAYRLRATGYAATYKNAKAIEDLKQSITLDPESYESYYTLGMVYLRSEEYQNAVDQLVKSIEKYKPKAGQEDQPYLQGPLTLASAYIELGKSAKDNEAAAKAAYQASADICDKLLKQLDAKNPLHAQARAATLYSLGVAQRMLDDYASAIRSFSQAIELNPEMGDAFFRRGICFHLLNEDKMAIADFEQSSHMGSDDPRANLWAGMSYAKLGDYYSAIRSYGNAIAVSDRYTPAYVNRGLAYMMLGDYEKAIADFDEALRLDPTKSDYYYKRGLRLRAYEEQQKGLRVVRQRDHLRQEQCRCLRAHGHGDASARQQRSRRDLRPKSQRTRPERKEEINHPDSRLLVYNRTIRLRFSFKSHPPCLALSPLATDNQGDENPSPSVTLPSSLSWRSECGFPPSPPPLSRNPRRPAR